VIWQTITFTSDADKEKYVRRELEINIAAANCPYIVKFFGAFIVEVGYFSPYLPEIVH